MRRQHLLALLAAVSAVSVLLNCKSHESTDRRAADVTTAHADRATRLFSRHCALCHGEDGSGSGPAFALLDPEAPDFGTGKFSLVSSENGIPSEEDLLATIKHGMPGSAMPPAAWMSPSDLRLLARHVRRLGLQRMASELQKRSGHGRLQLRADAALEIAAERWTAGSSVQVPARIEPNAQTLTHGKELYARHCAACHGIDGKGRGPVQAWKNAFDFRLARDFTRGILRGDASFAGISTRVLAGMPRAGMPPTRLAKPADTAALVSYVLSLMPAESRDRLQQRRTEIRARRVTKLPQTVSDPGWIEAEPRRIVLAPLAWSDDAILEAQVAALHDGHEFALRLTWKDPSEDRSPIASDAAAVQFSAQKQPAVFGMGSHDHPVNIWHWRAYRLRDVAGQLDLLDAPHGRRDPLTGRVIKSDAPLYRVTTALSESQRTADSLRAEGLGALRTEDGGRPVLATASWSQGQWQLVLRRSLQASAAREIVFRPGRSVQLGFALWNGAERRSSAFKSVTIWHSLRLDD